MNKDEIKGKAEVAKGRIKQAAADLSGDPDLHDEGVADELTGTVRETVGRGKRKVGQAVEDAGKAIKH
jgi:uncharacterized protein YjbJ (UPF0337 family)